MGVSFGGDAWLRLLQGIVAALAVAVGSDEDSFSMCATVVDVPAHLLGSTGDEMPSWHLWVRGRDAQVGLGQIPHPDVRITFRYPGLQEYLATVLTGRGDPEAPIECIEGRPDMAPGYLRMLHNCVAVQLA